MNPGWRIIVVIAWSSATEGLALNPIELIRPQHRSKSEFASRKEAKKLEANLLATDLDTRQPVPQTRTVSHQSFGSRLGDSLVGFIFGWVLIIFSFPVLWFNEGRNAKVESLLDRGLEQCRSISGKAAEKENRNWLVHLQGERMTATERVSDAQFNVSFDRGCVRLRTEVEVYQYIENQKKEEREKLGGGKETTITYTYERKWSAIWHNSDNYQDRTYVNRRPPGLDLGMHCTDCARVQCGEAFVLSTELVAQCTSFIPADPLLDSTVQARGAAFVKRGDGTFYHSIDGNPGADTQPRVGDTRVKFSYVPDGPVSLLALQADMPDGTKDTFLPYRLVARPWFRALEEEEEKAALRQRAQLSLEDLATQDQVGQGCLWCLCCACNLVQMCCAGVLQPEVYRLYHGSKTREECFSSLKQEMKLLVWALRLVGWLMLFIGLVLLFSPFLTFIKVIPFLGPILSNLGGFLVWVLSFVVTLVVASLIICLAYLAYHPFWSLVYSACAAGIVAISLAVIHFIH